jgi:hypothetical protein
MGEWMYRSTFPWPRHKLEVSGQLHVPAALPLVPTGGWVGPRAGLGGRGEEEILNPTWTRTPTPRSSRPHPVAIPTTLPRLSNVVFIILKITWWLPIRTEAYCELNSGGNASTSRQLNLILHAQEQCTESAEWIQHEHWQAMQPMRLRLQNKIRLTWGLISYFEIFCLNTN